MIVLHRVVALRFIMRIQKSVITSAYLTIHVFYEC